MNKHESIREKLALAAAGWLEPEEARQVQQHLVECESCRNELERLSLYSDSLRHLPQPSVPPGLVERTQARMLVVHAAAAARRTNDWIIAALAAFGWASSIGLWSLASRFVGDINVLTWSLASTGFVWVTAGAAAVLFGQRDWQRRNL